MLDEGALKTDYMPVRVTRFLTSEEVGALDAFCAVCRRSCTSSTEPDGGAGPRIARRMDAAGAFRYVGGFPTSRRAA